MSEKKWYRVVDPLSPLFGCDVQGETYDAAHQLMVIRALRRVDIFVGDRPFQLVSPKTEKLGLGLIISTSQLDDSPMQESVIEIGNDRPFGLCTDESELTRRDGYTLRIARYEHATQVAFDDPTGKLLASKTFYGESPDAEPEQSDGVMALFESGEVDDLVYLLQRRN